MHFSAIILFPSQVSNKLSDLRVAAIRERQRAGTAALVFANSHVGSLHAILPKNIESEVALVLGHEQERDELCNAHVPVRLRRKIQLGIGDGRGGPEIKVQCRPSF